MIARVVIIMQIAIILAFAMQDRPFEGQSLRCCTLIEPPAVVEAPDQKYGYGGIGMDYLEKLSRKLGFNCSSIRDYTKEGFTEFIKQMEDCTEKTTGKIRDDDNCECDFGTAGFIENDERYGRVDFLPEFLSGRFRLITHIENTIDSKNTRNGLFFLAPFSLSVWLSILSLTTIFALLKILDAHFSPLYPDFEPLPSSESLYKRLRHFLANCHISRRLNDAVKSIIGKLIGQENTEIEGDHGTSRQSALNITVLVCGLFLMLAFEAGLTASLVQENVQTKFRNIEDLKNCRIPAADVCVPDGGADRLFWERAVASQPCHKMDDEVATFISVSNSTQNTYENMVREVESKNCKYGVASSPTLEVAIRGKCHSLVITGEPFSWSGVSFILPRNSSYTAHMDNATLQLRNENAIPTLEEFLKGSTCHGSTSPTLTFQKLKFFFLFTFSLCILIFLKMILDKCHHEKESV